MVNYIVGPAAYIKILFHVSKHPHLQVNGVLLGKKTSNSTVEIVDAIPLLHHWTSLSPMMEIGLDLAGNHAESLGLQLVGYYQACERLDDIALAPVGEKVASKVKQGFEDAVSFVIDGEKIGSDEAALIPYIAQSSSSSWRPSTDPSLFTPGSRFSLSSPDLPSRAVTLVREQQLHRKFGDFDDHLEDVTIDWLRNRAAMPSDLQTVPE
ncbi:hypothetical protein GYMLUDRAFT_221170 [Collybiopsis luxurians FD-317 M1]|uniref:MPN domain-containing protein n=1 Tax=Collybiopsis luxurians FD-317 M1 TaxID=944289 RepID=A0A0D0C751_9AGAR|nr:hypothetical protein GYMLUDRAFT_221170 [Collybiopsis luxurians FD-317 M1]